MSPIVSLCWAPNAAGVPCLARVSWSKASGQWRSACRKCGASGFAAVGERNELDAAAVEVS